MLTAPSSSTTKRRLLYSSAETTSLRLHPHLLSPKETSYNSVFALEMNRSLECTASRNLMFHKKTTLLTYILTLMGLFLLRWQRLHARTLTLLWLLAVPRCSSFRVTSTWTIQPTSLRMEL